VGESEKIIISSRCAALSGELRVPGDKSISHRALILSALADGVSEISGLLEGDDVLSTLKAFRSMGLDADGPSGGCIRVHGVGMDGLRAPTTELDMANSGTAMRLLCGLLAAQKFSSRLVGDDSLSTRPMRRIATPLCQMGAVLKTSEDGTPPIDISPAGQLQGINYDMPVASAQVKSSLLLAGLYARGQTRIREPQPTRDHTERMLRAFGYNCDVAGGEVSVTGGGRLTATPVDVPADISSAAFFMVAASIVPGSHLLLRHVGVNPTRIGVIDILGAMGADIRLLNRRDICGEPVADIEIRYAGLKGIDVDPSLVPLAIDELPAICVAAACAEGETIITGAVELRHKESDRIRAMSEGLSAIGADVKEYSDGLTIKKSNLVGGSVDSRGDHRIAMSFAVAGAVTDLPVTISRCSSISTSFPGFINLARSAGLSVREEQAPDGS
jgi:3-phosphoshikimate 1-carboxyvinyltransferase